MACELEHLDEVQFGKLRKVMPAATLRDLVDTYLGDAETRLTTLETAAGRGDAAVVEQAAHALKGSSGMLGFARMATLCHQVETHAEDGDVAAAGSLLPGMRAELTELRRLVMTLVTPAPQ